GESLSIPHGLSLNPSALQGKACCHMSMSPCSRSRSYSRSLFCRLPTLLLSLCPRWACQSLLRSYSSFLMSRTGLGGTGDRLNLFYFFVISLKVPPGGGR